MSYEEISVLHVEDNPIDRKAVDRALRSESGLTVQSVASVTEATAVLQDYSFDVVLLDDDLVDGRGLDLLPDLTHVPVVFLTGQSDVAVVAEAMRSGAYDYLLKGDHREYAEILPTTLRNAHQRFLAEARARAYLSDLESFARMASHELKEPLRSLVMHTELLDRRGVPADSDLPTELGTLRGRARRSLALVEGLRRYAQLSTGESHREVVSLGDVLTNVLADLEALRIETKARVDVDELPNVIGDPVQIHEALVNLIGNALKFHRPGEPARVRVRAELAGGGFAALVVEDDGIGFDDRFRHKIFEAFQRLHHADQFEGTGMGLAIVKRIATGHGGSIEASGAVGEGATFRWTLPLEHAPAVVAR